MVQATTTTTLFKSKRGSVNPLRTASAPRLDGALVQGGNFEADPVGMQQSDLYHA